VASNTDTIVLQDISVQPGEGAGRYIQNVGANNCYYAFGATASPAYYNGILQAASLQQLDCSNCPQAVHVYSPGGTTIAVTELVSNDLSQGQGGILSANQANHQ
jgi:hypothetical protein